MEDTQKKIENLEKENKELKEVTKELKQTNGELISKINLYDAREEASKKEFFGRLFS